MYNYTGGFLNDELIIRFVACNVLNSWLNRYVFYYTKRPKVWQQIASSAESATTAKTEQKV